jgi:hypothetical protein
MKIKTLLPPSTYSSAAVALSLKLPKLAVTDETLGLQSEVFPCVILGFTNVNLESPGSRLPKDTSEAVTVELTSQVPTEPVTSTPVALAADVPMKVEAPSAMRAMAASLDLPDLASILVWLAFCSPYLFSLWITPGTLKLVGGAQLLARNFEWTLSLRG